MGFIVAFLSGLALLDFVPVKTNCSRVYPWFCATRRQSSKAHRHLAAKPVYKIDAYYHTPSYMEHRK